MKIKTLFYLGTIVVFGAIFALAALDLAFTGSITQIPASVNAGANVTFTVSFKTNGGAASNMTIIGGIDGTQLFTRTYANIGADLTRTDSFTWTATAGAHTAWFELDPGHKCGDSNYANNRIEKTFSVSGGTPSGKPDLYISSVTNSPVKFVEGAKVTLTITVSNKGTADSPASSLFMKDDKGKILMAADIPGIPKGLQYVHNIEWTGLCGTVLTIKVDSIKKADELDENNNEWLQTMKCTPKLQATPEMSKPKYLEDPNGPDLQVRIVSYKKFKHEDHEDLYISYQVSNWGKVASVPCILTSWINSKMDLIETIPAVYPGINYDGYYSVKFEQGMKVKFEIDSNRKNLESNEYNNIFEKTFKIIELKLGN